MFWDRFCKIVDKVNERTGQVLAWGTVVMLFIMMYEVISRYLFHAPTIWAWKVNTQIFSATLIMGGGYVLLIKGHVKLDLLYERVNARIQRIFDIATFPVMLVFFAIIIWQGIRMASSSVGIREHEMGLFQPPLYYNKIAFVIGAVLITLEGIATFVRRLKNKETVAEPSAAEALVEHQSHKEIDKTEVAR